MRLRRYILFFVPLLGALLLAPASDASSLREAGSRCYWGPYFGTTSLEANPVSQAPTLLSEDPLENLRRPEIKKLPGEEDLFSSGLRMDYIKDKRDLSSNYSNNLKKAQSVGGDLHIWCTLYAQGRGFEGASYRVRGPGWPASGWIPARVQTADRVNLLRRVQVLPGASLSGKSLRGTGVRLLSSSKSLRVCSVGVRGSGYRLQAGSQKSEPSSDWGGRLAVEALPGKECVLRGRGQAQIKNPLVERSPVGNAPQRTVSPGPPFRGLVQEGGNYKVETEALLPPSSERDVADTRIDFVVRRPGPDLRRTLRLDQVTSDGNAVSARAWTGWSSVPSRWMNRTGAFNWVWNKSSWGGANTASYYTCWWTPPDGAWTNAGCDFSGSHSRSFSANGDVNFKNFFNNQSNGTCCRTKESPVYTFTIDTVAPSSGWTTPSPTSVNSSGTAYTVNWNNGSDGRSGINYGEQYGRTATYSGGICVSWSGWSVYRTASGGGDQGTTTTASSNVQGKCFQYYSTNWDRAGNATASGASSVAVIDITSPTGGIVSQSVGTNGQGDVSLFAPTDAESGISSSGYQRLFKTANNNDGMSGWATCGVDRVDGTLIGPDNIITYSSIPAGNSTSVNLSDGCYQWRTQATNNVGLSKTSDPTSVVKVDVTKPTFSGGIGVNQLSPGNFDVSIPYSVASGSPSPSDWQSGISTRTLQTASAAISNKACPSIGSISPSAWTSINLTNNIPVRGEPTGCDYYKFTATNNAGLSEEISAVVLTDSSAPSGGSASASPLWSTSGAIDLSLSYPSDADSAISSQGYIWQTAPFLEGTTTCGSWGSDNKVYTSAASVSRTESTGCYRYRSFAINSGGLEGVSPWSSTVRVDTSAPSGGSITPSTTWWNGSGSAPVIGLETYKDVQTGATNQLQRRQGTGTLSGGSCTYSDGGTPVWENVGAAFADNIAFSDRVNVSSLGDGCFQWRLRARNGMYDNVQTNSETISSVAELRVDRSGPSAGSVQAPISSSNGAVSLQIQSGSDPQSGIGEESLQQRYAAFQSDNCPSSGSSAWTAWNNTSWASGSPFQIDNLANGCYQWRLRSRNRVGTDIWSSSASSSVALFASLQQAPGQADPSSSKPVRFRLQNPPFSNSQTRLRASSVGTEDFSVSGGEIQKIEPALLPASANLLGAWPMDGSSRVARDISGKGNDLLNANISAVSRSETVQSPAGNSSFQFSGTGTAPSTANQLAASSASIPSSITNATIAGWIRPGNHPDGSWGALWNLGGTDGNSTRSFNLFHSQVDNTVLIQSHPSGSTLQSCYTPAIPKNTWTHLVAVRNSSTGSIQAYINGQAVSLTGTCSASGSTVSTGANGNTFRIGSEENADRTIKHSFSGQMADVALWDKALSLSEVQELYRSPTSYDILVEPSGSGSVEISPSAQFAVRDTQGREILVTGSGTEDRAVTWNGTIPRVQMGAKVPYSDQWTSLGSAAPVVSGYMSNVRVHLRTDGSEMRLQNIESLGLTQGSGYSGWTTGTEELVFEGSSSNVNTALSNMQVRGGVYGGNSPIAQWGTQGTTSTASDIRFSSPWDIAADSSGQLYITDNSQRVQVINPDGTFVRQFSTGGSLSYGVAVTASHVYVTDSHRVLRFNKDGSGATTLVGSTSPGNGTTQFTNPRGIVVSSTGDIYVADQSNNRIMQFNASGAHIRTITSGFNNPVGLAIDPSDNLYVADLYNHRIVKLSSTGSLLATIGSSGTGNGQFQNPSDVNVDQNGNIFVYDQANGRVQKFSPQGEFLSKFGVGGGSGDEQFSGAHNVYVDSSGSAYVTDTGNHRVLKFNTDARQATPAEGGRLEIWVTRAGAAYNPDTDTYYQNQPSPISWLQARAENTSWNGMTPYLATISSAGEESFIRRIVRGNASTTAWIGGSDRIRDGYWMWSDGPEAGTQFWNGGTSGSPAMDASAPGLLASGGAASTVWADGSWHGVHVFERGTVSQPPVFIPDRNIRVEYLLVGGGGGGGGVIGGGGGAGGVLQGTMKVRAGQEYPVRVGQGGAGGLAYDTRQQRGAPGEDTTALGLRAVGGGAGAGYCCSDVRGPTTGGSGGGGSSIVRPGAAAVAGQGFAGGTAVEWFAPGGGGGAGAVGGNGTSNGQTGTGGAGGAGITSTISGASKVYGGGGGGGGYSGSSSAGAGGSGGGGAGTNAISNTPATSGTAGTGGGGGGAGWPSSTTQTFGGYGGSGAVVIRYELPSGRSYTPWFPGTTPYSEPNNSGGRQDCLQGFYPTSGRHWDDAGCDALLPVVYEYGGMPGETPLEESSASSELVYGSGSTSSGAIDVQWTSSPQTPTSSEDTLYYDLQFTWRGSGAAAAIASSVQAGDFVNEGTASGCSFSPVVASSSSLQLGVSGCSEGTLVPLLGAVGEGGQARYLWSGGERYRLHSFRSSGNLEIPTTESVEYLVVGGGGGGGSSVSGNWEAGGGGAGGVLSGSKVASPGTYPVTVGSGGSSGTNGQDSSWHGINALGGGAGGSSAAGNGSNGGSGGGGGYWGTGPGGNGTAGQGFNGERSGDGGALPDICCSGGGGGGSLEAGGTDGYGQGGDGRSSSITGAELFYGGGGGGVSYPANFKQRGVGGIGGGGDSPSPSDGVAAVGSEGTNGTGGGGGGGYRGGIGGGGGRGIVHLRYTAPDYRNAVGPETRIDRVAPKIDSWTRISPTSSPASTNLVRYELIFSEPVQNLSSTDFQLGADVGLGTGAWTVTSLQGSGAGPYVLEVGGTAKGVRIFPSLPSGSFQDLAGKSSEEGFEGPETEITSDSTNVIVRSEPSFWLRADTLQQNNGTSVPTWPSVSSDTRFSESRQDRWPVWADALTPRLWIDASNQSQLAVLENNRVASVDDRSSNDNDISQATTASQPQWIQNAIGSKGALRFDGGDWMDDVKGSYPGNLTIVAVAKNSGGDAGHERILNGTPSGDYRLFFGSYGSNFETFSGGGSSWNDTGPNSPSRSFDQPAVLSSVVSGASVSSFVNGTAQNVKNGTVSVPAFTGMRVGGFSGGQNFSGDLGEVLVFPSALSAADRQMVEAYLARKWGLSLEAANSYSSSGYEWCAPQGGVCSWDGGQPRTVVYGRSAEGSGVGSSSSGWIEKSVRSPVVCNDRSFGDPLPGAGKACFFAPASPASSGTKSPTYIQSSSLGGQPAVRFDGNDELVAGGYYGEPFTAFAVVQSTRASGTGGNDEILYGGVQDAFTLSRTDSNFYESNIGDTTWRTSRAANQPNRSIASPAIIAASSDGRTLRPYWNGEAQNTRSGGMTEFSGMVLGGRSGDDTDFIGDIGEVIYFPGVLSNTERQYIEGYLAWKFGLVSSLPTNHPYKSVEPETDGKTEIAWTPEMLRNADGTSALAGWWRPEELSDDRVWKSRFNYSQDGDFSPDGTRFYVPDRDNNRIQVFDSAGQFVREWGRAGNAAGEFSSPWDVSVAPNGTVLVADPGNSRVQAFDSLGRYLFQIGAPGGQEIIPQSVDVSPSGEIYITDRTNNRIDVFSERGAYLRRVQPTSLSSPYGLDFDQKGNFYLADEGACRVLYLSPEGRRLGEIETSCDGTGGGLRDVAVGKEGVYIQHAGRVEIRDPANGRLRKSFTGDAGVNINGAHGIALSPSDEIWVANSGAHNVVRFTKDGVHIQTIGGIGRLLFEGDRNTWLDASGRGRHLTTTNTSPPSVTRRAINGYNVANFDGNANSGSGQNLENSVAVGWPYSLYYVGRLTGERNHRLVSGANANSNWLLGYWNGLEDQFHPEGWVHNPSTSATTNWNIYGAQGKQRASGSRWTRFVKNGAQLAGTTGAYTDNNAPRGISLGASGVSAPYRDQSSGQVAEVVLVQSDLSEEDRLRLEGYLAWKFGRQNTLPDDHPYRQEPPTINVGIGGDTPIVENITSSPPTSRTKDTPISFRMKMKRAISNLPQGTDFALLGGAGEQSQNLPAHWQVGTISQRSRSYGEFMSEEKPRSFSSLDGSGEQVGVQDVLRGGLQPGSSSASPLYEGASVSGGGSMEFNGTSQYMEFQDGGSLLRPPAPLGSAATTSGAITSFITEGGSKEVVHRFITPGSITPSRNLQAEYLIVAGGGGGSGVIGGGGGGGGVLSGKVTLSAGQNYSVQIGSGGTGGVGNDNWGMRGNPGGDTTAFGFRALGGGGGAGWGINWSQDSRPATPGGSGGGGSGRDREGAPGRSGQGWKGGNGFAGTGDDLGGGGGGAGGAGGNARSGVAGSGGAGVPSRITGSLQYYGGGGGGGARNGTGSAGTGGSGGGGNGTSTTTLAASGTANTGGGGGGGGYSGNTTAQVGGNGGSGVAVVRYPMVGESTSYSGWARKDTRDDRTLLGTSAAAGSNWRLRVLGGDNSTVELVAGSDTYTWQRAWFPGWVQWTLVFDAQREQVLLYTQGKLRGARSIERWPSNPGTLQLGASSSASSVNSSWDGQMAFFAVYDRALAQAKVAEMQKEASAEAERLVSPREYMINVQRNTSVPEETLLRLAVRHNRFRDKSNGILGPRQKQMSAMTDCSTYAECSETVLFDTMGPRAEWTAVTQSPTKSTVLNWNLRLTDASPVVDIQETDITWLYTGTLSCNTSSAIPSIYKDEGVPAGTTEIPVQISGCTGDGTVRPRLNANQIRDDLLNTGPETNVLGPEIQADQTPPDARWERQLP